MPSSDENMSKLPKYGKKFLLHISENRVKFSIQRSFSMITPGIFIPSLEQLPEIFEKKTITKMLELF